MKDELLRDVRLALEQIERNEGLSNREAKAELRRRIRELIRRAEARRTT